ncbi:MAG: class I SAM-dependent methyltransferase [Desulfarculaceae bacterium]|nr:class I SAM-dependent methyltransferase [Desulfarculaceae bacterium]
MAKEPAQPRSLAWTPKLVGRFWDGQDQTQSLAQGFAALGGEAFVSSVSHLISRQDRILDFGAGDGQLVEILCRRGYQAAAFEPSAQRTATLTKKLAGLDGFLGVLGPDSGQTFDVVLLTEVIEHVLEPELDGFLSGLGAMLKPGGLLIVTAPNSEDLERSRVYCPVCDASFHRWQHVRSLDRDSLPALLSKYGFDEVATHCLEFGENLFPSQEAEAGNGEGKTEPPSHLRMIRENRPVTIGNEANLLYIGRKTHGLSTAGRARLRCGEVGILCTRILRKLRSMWRFPGH